ncbi:proline-rich receptor-like protein kinase PERK2 [Triticum aestivum]|uniref:proline-rich receptor-like protein kinase PERK2 n=1 Tax=Triticum aestivum TaxID=4565 RepID=UPI001D00D490|nr:proline-rich receptor-like protein kinase PERK2 [Triticum aestivum]
MKEDNDTKALNTWERIDRPESAKLQKREPNPSRPKEKRKKNTHPTAPSPDPDPPSPPPTAAAARLPPPSRRRRRPAPTLIAPPAPVSLPPTRRLRPSPSASARLPSVSHFLALSTVGSRPPPPAPTRSSPCASHLPLLCHGRLPPPPPRPQPPPSLSTTRRRRARPPASPTSYPRCSTSCISREGRCFSSSSAPLRRYKGRQRWGEALRRSHSGEGCQSLRKQKNSEPRRGVAGSRTSSSIVQLHAPPLVAQGAACRPPPSSAPGSGSTFSLPSRKKK